MVDIDVANLQPSNLNCDKLNEYITQDEIPNIWLEGNIIPVYKNKGAKTIHKTIDLLLF